jgi:cytidylate kinase
VVITIDGPGGVGKSTVARAVADALDLPHLDTGATYRAAALATLRAGGDPQDPEAVLEALDGSVLSFDNGTAYLDGEDVSADIRSEEVTAASSAVAIHPGVRERIVDLQRSWIWNRGGSGVVEGRDIGTVVFPDAEIKVYLTASPEVRAARRATDDEAAGKDIEAIAAELRARDHADSTRKTSPLKPAEAAVFIDTGDLSSEQVTELVLRQVAEAQALVLSSLLAEHSPEVVDLTEVLRGVVRSALPTATEKINAGWHGLGYHDPVAGYVAGIFPGDESVKLGFEHGVALSDPEEMLEGDGTQVRYVVLEAWDPALREPIIDLLHAAVEFGSS